MNDKTDKYIKFLLSGLGIDWESGGGSYILCGVRLCIEDTSCEYNIRQLYSAIGREYFRSVSTVEREIRNTIRAAWTKREEKYWQRVFVNTANYSEKPPVNSLFLSAMAESVRLGLFQKM